MYPIPKCCSDVCLALQHFATVVLHRALPHSRDHGVQFHSVAAGLAGFGQRDLAHASFRRYLLRPLVLLPTMFIFILSNTLLTSNDAFWLRSSIWRAFSHWKSLNHTSFSFSAFTTGSWSILWLCCALASAYQSAF